MKFPGRLLLGEEDRKLKGTRGNKAVLWIHLSAALSNSCRQLLKLAVVMALISIFPASIDAQRRRKPSGADAHYNQGLALLEKQQTDRAIAELKVAIALKPAYADAHNALGLALARK